MTGWVTAATDPTQAVGYPSLFVLVALGAVLPVIPTGALVSAAAVVAWHAGTPYDLPLVFVAATVAALAGDVILYWLARRGVGGWLQRLRRRTDTPRLDAAQRRLDQHGTAVIVVSRLVPAGRIPVMLACLGAGWSVRRFARSDIPAVLAWTGGYLLIGAVGGSLFTHPWQGLAAVVALTLLATVAPAVWRRVRARRDSGVPNRSGG